MTICLKNSKQFKAVDTTSRDKAMQCQACGKNKATTRDVIRRFSCETCAEITKERKPMIDKAVDMVKDDQGCVDVGDFIAAMDSLEGK